MNIERMDCYTSALLT